MDYGELIKSAAAARTFSYSPYSGYKVGAALLCADGTVFTGCNIENRAYGPSNCAERTAFFKAISEGKQKFTAIAIVGGEDALEMCYPCGVCRQVMAEFCDADRFEIVCGISQEQYEVYKLRDLLPHMF